MKNDVLKKRYFILLLSLLFIIPLFNGFVLLTRDGGLHSSYYFVGYSTGFGARKLLGTLFSAILPHYITHKNIIPFIFCVLVGSTFLFVNYVYQTFKDYDKQTAYKILPFFLLTAVYLSSDYGLPRTFSLVWYADIWLYLLTLLFVTLYTRHRSHKFWSLIYGAIIIVACLIHHIFCCLFLPLFTALFIYEIFNDGFSTKKALIYGSIGFAVAILFVYLWFFSTLNIGIEELQQQLIDRTNNVCDKNIDTLKVLYGPSVENYKAMWDIGQFPARYFQFPFLILLLSALIGFYITP